MFFLKSKIDPNLMSLIKENSYKKYRVLIKCKNLQDNTTKKISSYKGNLINSLEFSHIITAFLDARAIDRISEYPEVEKIVLDEYLFLCGMSVCTANKVNIPNKSSFSGKGVCIGLVDSGVYPHTDLLQPSNRIAGFTDILNELSYPYDDNGHGTAIAGIISGSGMSSNAMYKGIAPNSNIYCYKAFDKLGKGYASDILFSIEELLKKSDEFNIRVLCLPFELLTHNKFIVDCFRSVFDYAKNKNIIVVVPSGSNSSKDGTIMGIAALENCITVGGIDTSTSVVKPYTYSSCGPYKKLLKPNFSAACSNIMVLNSDISYISEKNGFKVYPPKLPVSYKTYSGTSISAAFISGVCALIIEKNSSLTFNDVYSLLKVCAEEEDFSKNVQGEGSINLNRLLN